MTDSEHAAGSEASEQAVPASPAIRLFGTVRLRTSGGGEQKPGKKTAALLLVLAAQGTRGAGRDYLATLLWGDRQDQQARGSLRQAVSTLRKTLEGFAGIESDGDTLRLVLEGAEVDTAAAEAAVRADAPMAQLAGLYTGPLGDGLFGLSPAFDRWLSDERMRLQGLLGEALNRWTKQAVGAPAEAQAAQLEAAETLARRLLDEDETFEAAHRTLMVVFAKRGHTDRAVRQFAQLEEILARELGSSPDPWTVSLRETLAAVGAAPAKTPPAQSGDKQAIAPKTEDPAQDAVTQWDRAGSPLNAQINAIWHSSDIRRIAMGLGIVAVLALAGLFLWKNSEGPGEGSGLGTTTAQGETPPAPEAGTPPAVSDVLVIRPFKPVGQGADVEIIADGLSEGLHTALGMVLGQPVRAVPRERDPAPDTRYVVEGAVQRDGDTVRVTARLIDRREDTLVWSQLLDRPVADVLTLQSDIVINIATALQISVSEGAQARASLVAGTRNLEAWLLAGRALILTRSLERAKVAEARRLYRRALKLDPDYVGAKAGLGWTQVAALLVGWSEDRGAARAEARALAADLLAREVSKAAGHALMALVHLSEGNHTQALSESQTAVRLNPESADIAALRGVVLMAAGESEQAVEILRRARSLSPRPPVWYDWVEARALRHAGRPREALDVLDEAEAAESPVFLIEAASTYQAVGLGKEAGYAMEALRREAPGFTARAWLETFPLASPEQAIRDKALLTSVGLPG